MLVLKLPPVDALTMSNTLSAAMTVVVITVMIVGRIDGMTTLKNTWRSVAPSIRAASSIESGTPLIAAEKTTVAKPVCTHTRMTISRNVFSRNVSSISHRPPSPQLSGRCNQAITWLSSPRFGSPPV